MTQSVQSVGDIAHVFVMQETLAGIKDVGAVEGVAGMVGVVTANIEQLYAGQFRSGVEREVSATGWLLVAVLY